MGLLDLPAPLFQLIDGGLTFFPATMRLILWSIVGGVTSMVFYALLSPQSRISAVKIELRESQKVLAESDESFAELMTVARKTLALSFKHLGLVFGPALISSLPLLCIMAWSSSHFGHAFPKPGTPVGVSVYPDAGAASLRWPAGAEAALEDNTWTVLWPDQAATLVLSDEEQRTLLQLPMAAPIPQVHKHLWWNRLLGNPAGYLPDETSVELLRIDLPQRRYLPFGPGWLSHWLTLFLLGSVAAALLTKKMFSIH